MNQRFSEVLKDKGISVIAFSKLYGCSRQYVSQIIKGESNIGLEFVNKLLDIVPDLNLNWFITGKGPKWTSGYKEPNSVPFVNDDGGKNCLSCHEKDEIIRNLNLLIKQLNNKQDEKEIKPKTYK